VKNPPVPAYAEFETHRTMLRDRIRTETFRRALEAAVKPGDVVLDVGTGTGILGLFAARAGAAKVYAVEQTSIARLAEELIAGTAAAASSR
jgi:predicted RNA methylase